MKQGAENMIPIYVNGGTKVLIRQPEHLSTVSPLPRVVFTVLCPTTGQEAAPDGAADAAGQQDQDRHYPHADPKGHAGHRAVGGQPKYLFLLSSVPQLLSHPTCHSFSLYTLNI